MRLSLPGSEGSRQRSVGDCSRGPVDPARVCFEAHPEPVDPARGRFEAHAWSCDRARACSEADVSRYDRPRPCSEADVSRYDRPRPCSRADTGPVASEKACSRADTGPVASEKVCSRADTGPVASKKTAPEQTQGRSTRFPAARATYPGAIRLQKVCIRRRPRAGCFRHFGYVRVKSRPSFGPLLTGMPPPGVSRSDF